MNEEENLIKEVNEEIQQDDYKKLWNKYGKYLISLFIIIILTVSSGTIYKNYRISKIEKESILYFEALELIKNENFVDAQKILKRINDSKSSGYSMLSALQILDLENKGKNEFNSKNLNIDKNPFFENYYILQKFSQNLEKNKDDISINKIINISQPGSPWRFSAHELLAAYYLKKNDLNNAIQSLNTIIEDDEVPIFAKERAILLFESLKK